jgi:SAM-dependent methyltransferase
VPQPGNATPLRGAHAAVREGYFDAIISLDAYHYFGTGEKYLSYCSSFLRPGGAIGIICPGNSVDLDELPGDQRKNFDGPDVSEFFTWHSAAWDGKQGPEDTVDGGFLLPASGRTLGFVRVIATKTA